MIIPILAHDLPSKKTKETLKRKFSRLDKRFSSALPLCYGSVEYAAAERLASVKKSSVACVPSEGPSLKYSVVGGKCDSQASQSEGRS